jgi:hypothetical protein
MPMAHPKGGRPKWCCVGVTSSKHVEQTAALPLRRESSAG